MSSRRRSGEDVSRRVFIQRLTFLGGGVVLLGACKRSGSKEGERRAPPKAFTTSHLSFTNPQYAVLSAACERILPRDEDPGALDAGVPEYIDRMLQTPEMRHLREDMTGGLDALDRRAVGMFGKGFAEATLEQQDQLLAAFKDDSPTSGEAKFYEYLVVLTLEGFLGDPSYGGNKDRVGWALVGFDTSAPPPGYDGKAHLHGHREGGGH